MKLILRDYQQKLLDEILGMGDLQKRRIVAQLETGGGKSVVISRLANVLLGRTLILTHRVEILEQNSDWIEDVGILAANKNTVGVNTRIVVAMVQTLDARIKKYGIDYLGYFNNIILDEVHVQIFEKVFSKYPFKFLIGFTATPVINKKITIEKQGVEYIKKITFSETFDDIVVGPPVQKLIDDGHLVQDFNVSLQLPNFDKLRHSIATPDGYTYKSLEEVYSNTASLEVLSGALNTYCKGKKTLIFNATTSSNKYVHEALVEANFNVKMFDTVNSRARDRESIVEWFKNERDAVLVGTNVFTTGFNVTDIECVIINRATKSLGLWIQMVGRGARTTDVIPKDHFTVIDLGQNIERHGIWSAERDWRRYFDPQPLKLKNQTALIDTWGCVHCGGLTPIGEELRDDGEFYCMNCGSKKSTNECKLADKKDKDGTLTPIGRIPLPSGSKIIDYCKSNNQNTNFAFRLLEKRMLSLFVHYNVAKGHYVRNKERYHKRVEQIYRPIYFAIIKSGLEGANKTYKNQIKRMITKIETYYGEQAELVD